MLKEKAKVPASGDKSSNASSTAQLEFKETGKECSGKGKIGSSASKSSVNTMERKVKDKLARRGANSSNDTCSGDLISVNPSCASSTKSDDSEQGSVSDVTAANGSNNDTGSRKQDSALNFQIGARLEAKDLGSEIW
jgi:hypothetical protein